MLVTAFRGPPTNDRAPRTPTPRQRELLQSIAELFNTEGFRHLTLDDLASRLHCSKSILYRLAPSKDELVVTALQWRSDVAREQLERDIARASTAWGRVEAFVRSAQHYNGRYSTRLMADVMAVEHTRVLWDRGALDYIRRVEALISEGIGAGEFREVSPLMAGLVIGFMIDIIRRGLATEVSAIASDDAYDSLLQFVHGALVPPNKA